MASRSPGPAGLGCSAIVPLIKAGFVDWIVSTGAILYHDMHFALNYPVRVGSSKMDDTELRDNDIVRVVCYTDTTIAMPILTHYALARHKPRKLRRLYDQRPAMLKALTKEYFLHNQVKMIDGSEPVLG